MYFVFLLIVALTCAFLGAYLGQWWGKDERKASNLLDNYWPTLVIQLEMLIVSWISYKLGQIWFKADIAPVVIALCANTLGCKIAHDKTLRHAIH